MVLLFGLVFFVSPRPLENFSADTLGSTFLSVAQRHRKEGKWGHASWGAGLGGASTHFIQTFK